MNLIQGIFTITLLFSMCLFTHGWLDEVHMITGGIARSMITEAQAEKVESFLARWEYNYPGFGSIENATTWTDNTRCGHPGPNNSCGALPFIDNYSVFNNWHFNEMPRVASNYNVDTCGMPDNYYWVTTGSNFVLNEFFKFFNWTYENPCTDTSCPTQPGYDFSWNFALRMFLHIYGDFHNPCHAGYGINQFIPEGDSGCSYIYMGGDFEGKTLHQVTDSVFNRYTTGNMATGVPASRTATDVETLKARYPFDEATYGAKFHTSPFDVEAISQESFEDHGTLYEHFDFNNYNPATDKVVYNQTSYDELYTMLEKRSVLAGYRMGQILDFVARAYPDMSMSNFPQMPYPPFSS